MANQLFNWPGQKKFIDDWFKNELMKTNPFVKLTKKYKTEEKDAVPQISFEGVAVHTGDIVEIETPLLAPVGKVITISTPSMSDGLAQLVKTHHHPDKWVVIGDPDGVTQVKTDKNSGYIDPETKVKVTYNYATQSYTLENPYGAVLNVDADAWQDATEKEKQYYLNFKMLYPDKGGSTMQVHFDSAYWNPSVDHNITMPKTASILDCFLDQGQLYVISLWHDDDMTPLMRTFKAVSQWEGSKDITDELAYVGLVREPAPDPPKVELSLGGSSYHVPYGTSGSDFFPSTSMYVIFEVMTNGNE